MIELELPWPPSVNHYWRSVPLGKYVRVLISKKGRQYREDVKKIVAESGIKTVTGAVAIKRILYCPDYRERDEDNTAKAIYDSLTKAGAIEGDQFVCFSQCEKRIDSEKTGRVIVQIKQVSGAITKKAGAWLE